MKSLLWVTSVAIIVTVLTNSPANDGDNLRRSLMPGRVSWSGRRQSCKCIHVQVLGDAVLGAVYEQHQEPAQECDKILARHDLGERWRFPRVALSTVTHVVDLFPFVDTKLVQEEVLEPVKVSESQPQRPQ